MSCARADYAFADDIPGVADFASDLDEDDDEDDEEEDDEEADASDDGVAPPPASTKGKGSLRPKAAPKLPPKKGALPFPPRLAAPLNRFPPSVLNVLSLISLETLFDSSPCAGGRTRVEIEYETETSGTANVNYDQ